MNHHTDKHSPNETPNDVSQQASGFFYREDVIRWILRIFYVCCVALVLIDFFIHRHTVIDLEKVPGFYAIYGFVACVILVVIAKWMRIFLIRDENYYEEAEDSEEFLRKQGLALPETYSTPSIENTDSDNHSDNHSNNHKEDNTSTRESS